MDYYKKISAFYDTYLKSKTIANNIIFYSEGFAQIDETKILRTKKISNYLRFNGNNDYNIFSGLKNYGPFKVPPTDNLRFIFIYKKNENHRNAANQLYLAFKNGLANNFPGLKDYIRVNFELANVNKIILESDDPSKELEEKLKSYQMEEGKKYFAIYLTNHKRFDEL